MTGVVYGEETAPRYEYDYNAKGQVARVRDNLLNRTTQSEYDLANRPVRVKTSEDAKHVYTGQVAYDNVYGNLSEFTEKVGENRQEFGTKFGYDDENRPTSLTYSVGATTIGQSTTTIDKLNRTTFSAVKLGSKTFTSEYHFAAGGYGTGSVTNLAASITQPGCNCGYGYDDNGNIASATLNGKWTGYSYDALGQLIQVNDHSDTRSGENGTTWKYTYDLGGNILKKERFVYNDTTNPLETVTYEYGDANWRDKLTAVNGSTIRYDAIGNPLSDGTWTYTWQNGRQLQKMQKAGVTAEFVYNADGLRVQKMVNGVVTDYVLHGKNVVHMKRGADELHFFYDAQNRPAVVVYNGVPYAYVKSLQGDVIAILDAAGNVVVSYVYDAWGAPIGKAGSMNTTLGVLNPFRYRGYVFDEETQSYYLCTRYYNPIWGKFTNPDTILGKIGKYFSHNIYTYCQNSAIVRTDTNGRESNAISNNGGVDRPLTLEYGNSIAPATLNPYRDWKLGLDVTMPLIEEKELSVHVNVEDAKRLSDTLTANATWGSGIMSTIASIPGAFCSPPVVGVIYSILVGGGSLAYSLSQSSTYVVSQDYHITIATYDASAISDDRVYVLICTTSESESAINSDWYGYGIDQSELDYDYIVKEALCLTLID